MNRILIIDGNNLAHRATHKFNLTTGDGRSSSVVYGFVYILSSLLTRLPSDEVFVVFDGSRSKHRIGMLPDYKQRTSRFTDKEHSEFVDQIDWLKNNLGLANCKVVHDSKMEADDLIYIITKLYPKSMKTIVSSDKDFIQLLGPKVKIYNPFKNKIVHTENVVSEYGFSEKECVDYLSLDGDKSDHIPGVPGMGPVRIREFLDTFGSVPNFLEAEDRGKFSKYEGIIRSIYTRNKSLIGLRSFFIKFIKIKEIPIARTQWDEEKFNSKLLRDFQIRLFTKPGVVKVFKRLNV